VCEQFFHEISRAAGPEGTLKELEDATISKIPALEEGRTNVSPARKRWVELEIMASPGRGDTDDADPFHTRLLITMVQEIVK
jgi:hypothetical protein